jgi:hypothetical protein
VAILSLASPVVGAMASVADHYQAYALIQLGSRLPLYITCASRREIRVANLRLWRGGLPLRYVPRPCSALPAKVVAGS